MTIPSPETVSLADAETARRALKIHPPLDGRHSYLVGAFSQSITFYRQQIRALNLIYALRHSADGAEPRLATGSRVAVIGAGAFGLTAAAAARIVGYRVDLFERAQQPLMLQSGCTTRWLHPRSYDWPAPEAQIRDARLPVLNWTAARAAEVAEMVTAEFERLKAPGMQPFEAVYDVSEINVEWRKNKSQYRVRYSARDAADDLDVDAVIYATGFGADTNNGQSVPYWRNDDLGQPAISSEGQVSYCVSGTGDGGLVDLLRLRLLSFRQDRILGEVFEQTTTRSGDPLHHILDGIAKQNADPRKVWQRLKDQEQRAAGLVIDALKARLRTDTRVMLIGKKASFADCLSDTTASFGNALLALLLHNIRAFEYCCGPLEKVREAQVLPFLTVTTEEEGKRRLIIRHGTDRHEALRGQGLSEAEIKEVRRRHDDGDWPANPLYPPGWWDRFTQEKNARGRDDTFVAMEHVPKELHSHATVFVRTLAAAVGTMFPNDDREGPGYRLALHCLRESSRDKQPLFHQVTDYAGWVGKNEDRLKGVGRTFPAEKGVVGLACQSGRVVIVRGDEAARSAVLKDVQLREAGAKEVRDGVMGFLAYPILSNDGTRVMMVLFADVSDASVLEPGGQLIGLLDRSCHEFVEALEMEVANGAIRAVPAGYKGFPIVTGDGPEALLTDPGEKGAQFCDLQPASFQTILVPDFEASDAGAYRQSGNTNL